MNENNSYLATNLKYLRNANNKTLQDICSVVDKSLVAIHYWEEGTREPNAVDIAKLSNYYKVSVDDLLLKDLRFEKENIESTLQNAIMDNVKLCTKEEQEQILSIINVIKKGNK